MKILDVEHPPMLPPAIPKLKVALDLATWDQDPSLLKSRAATLNTAQIPWEFLLNLYRSALSTNSGTAILEHERSFSAAEKIEILNRERLQILKQLLKPFGDINIDPVKTITLTYDNLAMLVYGFGDFRLDRQTKRQIGQLVHASNEAIKRAKINDSSLSPLLLTNTDPGIVGPYAGKHRLTALHGTVFVDQRGRTQYVALAPTHWETMIVSGATFNLEALNWHSKYGKDLLFKSVVCNQAA